MSSFTKLVLVPPEMVNYQKPGPLAGELTKLDKEMQVILNNPTLSMEVKHKLYNQVLHRYNFFKNESAKPVKIEIQDRDEKNQTRWLKDVVDKLPKQTKSSGNKLKDLLENTDHLTWNKDGEIIYQGDVVPNSNIDELLRYTSRNVSHSAPAGLDVFMKWLKKENVPEFAIGNKKIRDRLNPVAINWDDDMSIESESSKSTGKTKKFNTPPGFGARQRWLERR
jgi:hypothetical protein